MPKTQEFSIGCRLIGEAHPCFVIAEVGINHGGNESVAAEMITAAASAGADAVKLQTVTPEQSYHPETESYRVFRDATLSRDALVRLMVLAASTGTELFSTPGDFKALRLISEIGMPAIKISSGLMTNLPLIMRAAKTGLPLIISTGMAYLDEVVEAVDAARGAGATKIVILQCTSIYPAPPESLNLRTMRALFDATGCLVGYSDHHDGTTASIAAVAAGAVVLEKHFTLDRAQPGEDHAISLEPDSFKAMVKEIRNVETMLGRSEKSPSETEMELRSSRHRRLTAGRDIAAGETIGENDLLLMRLPPDMPGMEARRMGDVIGKRALTAIRQLTGISPAEVEGLE